MRVRLCSYLVAFAAVLVAAGSAKVLAGKTSNLPVTSYLSDYNAAGTQYSVLSDGKGAYQNGLSGVQSVLEENGYNQIVWGDWLLNLFGSTTRTVAVTFSSANAVQPSDPSYTAPANPPYWGTEWAAMHLENQCTFGDHDMYTMKAGDKSTCDFRFRFPAPSRSPFYRLDMVPHQWAESQQAQVQCNSVSSVDGNCNDWYFDPVPVTNSDGSTSPGQTRARLVLVTSGTSYVDEGDFYLTFHIEVTRP